MTTFLREIKMLDFIKWIIGAIIGFYALYSPIDRKLQLHDTQIAAHTEAINEIKTLQTQNRDAITKADVTLTELSSYLKGKGIYK